MLDERRKAFQAINHYFDAVYVLTLERATDRQAAFREAFDGLDYQFFLGADKAQFHIPDLIQAGIYSEELAIKNHRYSRPMSPGQIGCSWSHRQIYEQILAKNQQRVLILEDDSIPEDDVLPLAATILQAFPNDWELVLLDYYKNEKRSWIRQFVYHLKRTLGLLKWNHRMIRNLFPTPVNTYISKAGFHHYTNAYAITASGAAKLIQLQTPIAYVADHVIPYAITNELMRGYICHPKLFRQTSTGADATIQSFVGDGR